MKPKEKKYFYLKGVFIGEGCFELSGGSLKFEEIFEIKSPEVIVLHSEANISYLISKNFNNVSLNLESYELIKKGFHDAIKKEISKYILDDGDVVVYDNDYYYIAESCNSRVKLVKLSNIFKNDFSYILVDKNKIKNTKLNDRSKLVFKKWVKSNDSLLEEYKDKIFKSLRDDFEDFRVFAKKKFLEVNKNASNSKEDV